MTNNGTVWQDGTPVITGEYDYDFRRHRLKSTSLPKETANPFDINNWVNTTPVNQQIGNMENNTSTEKEKQASVVKVVVIVVVAIIVFTLVAKFFKKKVRTV